MKTIGIFFFLLFLGVGLVSAGLTVNFQPANGTGGGAVWGNITGNINDQTDLMNELNQKVSKSGDTMTGQLNMDSNKITNLADGTDTEDAVNLGQLQELFMGTRAYSARSPTNWNGATTYLSGNGISHSSTKGYRMPSDGYIRSISQELDVVSCSCLFGTAVTSRVRINGNLQLSSLSPNFATPGFYTSSNVAAAQSISFNEGDFLQVSIEHPGLGNTMTLRASANVEVVFK